MDGGSTITIYAGELRGSRGLPPPPHSWAADAENDVAVWHIALKHQSSCTLPAAKTGRAANRSLYLTAGPSVTISGRKVEKGYFAQLDASLPVDVVAADGPVELLLLQGERGRRSALSASTPGV